MASCRRRELVSKNWKPATQEEIDRVNAIREEKRRPENVVVLPLSAVPLGYRYFLSEGDRDA